jgi:hypothetical protein
MGIPTGSVADALKNTRVVTSLLILVIAVAAVLIGQGRLSTGWTVTAQIASAIAGAALGNFLRLDISQSVVRNQARPATRHLFDRATRLRALVVKAEGYESQVTDMEDLVGVPLDQHRIADWFGVLGDGMRAEIDATATAIENWGDMAKDVVDAEVESYNTRNARLPAQGFGQEEAS